MGRMRTQKHIESVFEPSGLPCTASPVSIVRRHPSKWQPTRVPARVRVPPSSRPPSHNGLCACVSAHLKDEVVLRDQILSLSQGEGRNERSTCLKLGCIRRTACCRRIPIQETAEWLDALESTVTANGLRRAHDILSALAERARQGIGWHPSCHALRQHHRQSTDQPAFPGDLAIEERLASRDALERAGDGGARQPALMANSAATSRATPVQPICSRSASTTSSARGDASGDLVFYQPHSAPGVYARAFLEGRLSERRPRALPPGDHRAAAQGARGLSQLPASVADAGLLAVPHRLDGHRPDQLDLPRALHALPAAPQPARHVRGRKVWGVFGDGEMDEPEA